MIVELRDTLPASGPNNAHEEDTTTIGGKHLQHLSKAALDVKHHTLQPDGKCASCKAECIYLYWAFNFY